MQSRRSFGQYVGAIAASSLVAPPQWVRGTEDSPQKFRTKEGSVAVGKNVVATVHPIASQASIECYRHGGNAIDAAIAAALCLGVVDGHNSGIGGGCLIMVRTESGAIHAIDGRETAPEAIQAAHFVRDGKPSVELSQTGPLAAAVPSQVAALSWLHHKLGKLPWPRLFDAAIAAAEDGYVVSKSTFEPIAGERVHLSRFEASRKTLLKADGSPYAIGEKLRQLELGRTLRKIATEGPNWFYQGEFAKRCVEYLRSLGGVMTLEDLANYRVVERSPIESNYRDYRVFGFPPPSSGGTHIAQMLNILGQFDLQSIYRESPPKYFHLLAESMKLAFADRAHWLGDTDFVTVPAFLTDPAYGISFAKRIDLDRRMEVNGHGTFPASDDSKKHTTHLCTADAKGNWVAITSTINTAWGSKVMVPETGVMLNNQMDDFSIAPGTPNAFGLLGALGNAIEPKKRPLSSMSPTVVLRRDGSVFLSCGAAGGPKIINATLQMILGCVDLKMSLDQTIAMPRIHHQWRPDVLSCEFELAGETQSTQTAKDLESMGHSIKKIKSIAVAQGVQSQNDGLMAASDPRVDGSALVF